MTLEINVFTMKRYNSFVFIKLFFFLLSLILIVRKAEDATERFNGEDTLTLHALVYTYTNDEEYGLIHNVIQIGTYGHFQTLS